MRSSKLTASSPPKETRQIIGTRSQRSLSVTKERAKHLRHISLTSRLWEETFGGNSLMKSSRSLAWLVWEVAGGAGGGGVASPETPSALCLMCSFWRRRSFLKSLAFRHGGRLASAPRPARHRAYRGEQNFWDVSVWQAKEKKTFHYVHSEALAIAALKMSVSSCWSFSLSHQQIWLREQREPQRKEWLWCASILWRMKEFQLTFNLHWRKQMVAFFILYWNKCVNK